MIILHKHEKGTGIFLKTNESRLHTMTDAVGSVATYAYNVDNTLSGTTYTPASGVASTPNVSFSYDSVYNRVTSMGDGTGTTSYSYNPINAALGAGRLSSISVPIAGSSATVSYSYDELGRVTERDVDHSTTNANNVGTTFDALGRVTGVSNALGAFTYAYVDETSRLSGVTYPSGTGLTTSYSYFGNTGDQRLEEIKNMQSTTQLSKFDYTYNAVGTIATWTTQADSSTAIVNTLSYDNADQLTSAVQSGGGSASNAYGYDPAGNRLSEVTGSGTTAGQFNNVNQLTRLSNSTTSQTVAGHTSAAITSATVNAVPATISSSTNFTANVALPAGTNVVSVVATPTTNNIPVTTQQYQFVTTGSTPATLAYDANGNITTDENGNNYKWDALNRLTAIIYNSGTYSGTHTEFAYDGLSRRVSIVERAGTTVGSGTVSSTKNYLWIGSEMAEERDASNTVTKRFFPQGEQQSGTDYYYTRDHLGSVREMCSSAGSIVARYGYDPYGRTTLISGSNFATFQFAMLYAHQPSGLYLSFLGNTYDSARGSWIGRDPLGEAASQNLYTYVANNPINLVDPFGLDPNQTVVIDLKNGTLTLYNGGTNTTPVLTTEIVHGAGTTQANTTSTGTFTLGPWQTNKTSSAYGWMTNTPYSQSWWGGNAYGPYFTSIIGSNGDGIHGTMGWSWTWFIAKRAYPVSHGCVRVPNSVIENMHNNVLKNPNGTKVIITN